MRYKAVLIIWMLMVNGAVAQQPSNPLDAQVNVNDLAAGTVARAYDNRFEGVKGYPTLFENFVSGSVTINGSVVPLKAANYDSYHDDFLTMKNKVPVVLSKSMVNGFSLFNGLDSLYFTRFNDQEGKPRFFQELVHARVGLYKVITKTLLEPNYTGAFSANRNYAEFIQSQTYVVRMDDRRIVEITNKKNLLQEFPSIADKLQVYCKTNHVDFKREDHLIALLLYLNQELYEPRFE